MINVSFGVRPPYQLTCYLLPAYQLTCYLSATTLPAHLLPECDHLTSSPAT